jgi:hypothetical protein
MFSTFVQIKNVFQVRTIVIFPLLSSEYLIIKTKTFNYTLFHVY